MKATIRAAVCAGLLLLVCAGCWDHPGTVRLEATSDFAQTEVEGYAPYYAYDRRGNSVLNVDADKTGYQFGAAQTVFADSSGYYDLTIHTLGDQDGACQYKVKVGDAPELPVFMQPKAEERIYEHTWENVYVANGDLIRVMSNGSDSERHGGGKGPNGFHMAHGRWTLLELVPTGEE